MGHRRRGKAKVHYIWTIRSDYKSRSWAWRIKKIKGFVRTMLGFPEELIEACANLYNEVVVALAALRDSTNSPNYYLGFLQIL